MSRLTYKLNEQEQEEHKTKYLKFEYFPIPDYCIEKGNYGRITSDMIYKKLGQLEDLEEELGCPLEVIFKALTIGIWYEDVANRMTHIGVGLDTANYDCEYILREYNNETSFLSRNYKKTWWLRKDKSE